MKWMFSDHLSHQVLGDADTHVSATGHIWLLVNIGSGNGLVLSSNKTFSEPVSTKFYDIIEISWGISWENFCGTWIVNESISLYYVWYLMRLCWPSFSLVYTDIPTLTCLSSGISGDSWLISYQQLAWLLQLDIHHSNHQQPLMSMMLGAGENEQLDQMRI